MSFNGTIVGSPTFGAVKFGNGLTGTSDANYISLPGGTLPGGVGPMTIEAWLKTTATATKVAISNTGSDLWFGVSSGEFQVAGGASVPSGIAINDGAWHHCALVIDSSGVFHTYVDGVAGSSGGGAYGTRDTSLQLGNFAGVAGGFGWAGSIDEVAIWSIAKYSGSYAVPTAPYAGSETGLNALYHLEADGTDGTGAGPSLYADRSYVFA